MSEQENTKLVREAYETFKGANMQASLRKRFDNVIWQLPEIEDVPCEGVREFFATFAEAQEAKGFEPKEFIAQADKVVALGHYTWRAKSTGREYGGHWAHVIGVRDGKIVAFQVYCCVRVAMDDGAQLGAALIMSEPENTKLVREAYETFRTGKTQALGDMFSADIEWQLPETKNTPSAGRPNGREQVCRFFASFADSREARGFEPKDIIAQADKVVALGHYTRSVMFTGQEYRGDWAHVFTIRDQRIAGLQVYYCPRTAPP
jgi:ketosteroid isomerase-like protein